MKTAGERSMDHQRKLQKEGWRRLSLWLSPMQGAGLKEASERTKRSQQELARTALTDALADWETLNQSRR